MGGSDFGGTDVRDAHFLRLEVEEGTRETEINQATSQLRGRNGASHDCTCLEDPIPLGGSGRHSGEGSPEKKHCTTPLVWPGYKLDCLCYV